MFFNTNWNFKFCWTWTFENYPIPYNRWFQISTTLGSEFPKTVTLLLSLVLFEWLCMEYNYLNRNFNTFPIDFDTFYVNQHGMEDSPGFIEYRLFKLVIRLLNILKFALQT